MNSGVSGAVVILAFFIGVTVVTYLVGYLIIKIIKKIDKKDNSKLSDADDMKEE